MKKTKKTDKKRLTSFTIIAPLPGGTLMQYVVPNLPHLVMLSLALCGEVSRDMLSSLHLDVDKNSMYGAVSKLKGDNNIKESKGGMLRLRDSKGLNLLGEMSAEALEHYMLISSNHKFYSGDRGRAMARYAKASFFMLRNDVAVNGFDITYRSNSFGKESVENEKHGFYPSKIADLKNMLDLDKENYLSMQVVKRVKENQIDRAKFSRSVGLFFSNNFTYICYYVSKHELDMRANFTAENSMWLNAMEVYEYFYDRDRYEIEIPSLFVLEDKKLMYSFLKSDRKTKMYPSAIDERFYVLPDDADGDAVLNLITESEYKSRLLRMLYYEDEIVEGKQFDAVVDGVRSYEFLSCNFTMLDKIKNKEAPVQIVCHGWQVEMLKDILRKKNNVEYIIVEKDDFTKLMENLKGESNA